MPLGSILATLFGSLAPIVAGWMWRRCQVSYATGASNYWLGVVWLDKGVVYLMSPGRPTDIGLQLGKACCPCRDVFTSSVSSLSFIFLSPLSLSFISSTISSVSLLPCSGRWHKITHRVDVSVNPNSVNQKLILASSWVRPAILVAGKGRLGMFLLRPPYRRVGDVLFLGQSPSASALYFLSAL